MEYILNYLQPISIFINFSFFLSYLFLSSVSCIHNPFLLKCLISIYNRFIILWVVWLQRNTKIFFIERFRRIDVDKNLKNISTEGRSKIVSMQKNQERPHTSFNRFCRIKSNEQWKTKPKKMFSVLVKPIITIFIYFLCANHKS